jgi:hypothetical protein
VAWNPTRQREDAVATELDSPPDSNLTWKDNFGGPYTIECYRQRFWAVETGYLFRTRHVDCRIIGPSGICAAAKFVEWKTSSETEIDDFVEEADALSQADYEMALSVRLSWHWPIYPFDYGTLVRDQRLWHRIEGVI